MKFTITAKTTPECDDFLKIIHNSTTYSFNDFTIMCKDKKISIDECIPECSFVYRDKHLTYHELCNSINVFANKLPFLLHYQNIVFPIEHKIYLWNKDYYTAGKVIEKVENCLQNARYYLLKSFDIFTTNFEINWDAGYQAQFGVRTINFSTSIIWYNNCFDYILQIPYFAYKFYKKVAGYSEDLRYAN